MMKAMWESIIGYMIGAMFFILFTILLFRIGINEQTTVLIAFYGWLGGSSVWYANFVNRNKKTDYEKYEKALNEKADSKDVIQIRCTLEEVKNSLTKQESMWVKMSETINQIYKEMPKE